MREVNTGTDTLCSTELWRCDSSQPPKRALVRYWRHPFGREITRMQRKEKSSRPEEERSRERRKGSVPRVPPRSSASESHACAPLPDKRANARDGTAILKNCWTRVGAAADLADRPPHGSPSTVAWQATSCRLLKIFPSSFQLCGGPCLSVMPSKSPKSGLGKRRASGSQRPNGGPGALPPSAPMLKSRLTRDATILRCRGGVRTRRCDGTASTNWIETCPPSGVLLQCAVGWVARPAHCPLGALSPFDLPPNASIPGDAGTDPRGRINEVDVGIAMRKSGAGTTRQRRTTCAWCSPNPVGERTRQSHGRPSPHLQCCPLLVLW
ncbi:hypothetical protein N658DRAFT_346537 [Parathielavia hyrcaniae]|uniref:Uncharacterized protein n=1 Tax=Parathielavia hyrcaniae TaxID=113614 RepID=A0AAN6SXH2_9PEZI|nr:hypothetical protein N658DRAFT_346537 [Parathielavia hyrcaniae]